jgi:hypothetical protein
MKTPDEKPNLYRIDENGTITLPQCERCQWRPIKTAPRDGTRVIVSCHAGSAGYLDGIGRWGVAGPTERWICLGKVSFTDPTHWMPLPPPPEVAP